MLMPRFSRAASLAAVILPKNNSILPLCSPRNDVCCPWVAWRNYAAQALRSRKRKSEINRAKHFVDWRKIQVTGGTGGDGMIAFLRLWNNPMAGPSGGDGGNGGHVLFQADSSVKDFSNVSSQYKAESGEDGLSKDMTGKNGEHTIIPVPVGTLVKDENDVVKADLKVHGAKFIAARGGAGGKGNAFFLSNENRHPHVAEVGAEGETKKYTLELKILAHVGMVGFPNVGKSTLLRAISRARPKVASYPFTTLNPHVGIVFFDDFVQMAVADMPGLIPGAHQNKGLGFSFLRHIERCVCLLYVIDISLKDPIEQLEHLQYELEMYEKGLSKRPGAVVANKIDVPGSIENLKQLRQKTDLPIFPVSAKFGKNTGALLKHMRELYDANQAQNALQW